MSAYSIFDPELERYAPSALDLEQDALVLTYIARYGGSATSRVARRMLGDALTVRPEDESPENDERYWLILRAARQETDIERLESALFATRPVDGLIRRMAFARLTGARFYERNDSFSHRSFACGRAPGVTDATARAVCERVLAEERLDKAMLQKARALMEQTDGGKSSHAEVLL